MMKVFAGLVVLAALAMGAAMVVGGRAPAVESRPTMQLAVASPADSFVIHDAPAAAPSVVSPAPATPDPAAASGLDAAIEKLRAANANPDVTATPPAPASVPDTAPAVAVTADPLLAGPAPAPAVLAGPPPAPPPPAWSVVTSQGVRWRSAPNALVIDMGGGRNATIYVDPAFANLPQEAASTRVDFLKQTILESFPPGSSQFRFARDGSVSLVR